MGHIFHTRDRYVYYQLEKLLRQEQLRKKREKQQLEYALRHIRVHPFYPEKEGDPRRGNWRESQAKDTK